MDRHATLVAFYAESKPSGLGDYVGGVQRRLVELLGGLFQPRPMPDVHATIIGLESFGRVQPPQELTELRASGSGRPDIAGLCAYLNTTLGQHPPQIQFGGFPNRDLGVTSRGQRLYTRTLTTNANQVILMAGPSTNRVSRPRSWSGFGETSRNLVSFTDITSKRMTGTPICTW